MKRMVFAVLRTGAWLTVAALPGLAAAHDAWLEAAGADFVVRYGHGDKHDSYAVDKVRDVRLLDAAGKTLASARRIEADTVRVGSQGRPALATLLFDNGYWSRTSMDTPSKNVAKNELPGAITGSHSVKTHKLVLEWTPAVGQAQGQRLEIVPLAGAAPSVGTALPVQVLWDGQPLAGAKLKRGGYDKDPGFATDAQGRTAVPVAAGRQMLVVSHSVDLVADPRADKATWSANLVFVAK